MASSLTIEGVHAAYGAVRVIEDVSMTVNAGETVALLGTNGNGKSTLMKCVMGMLRPTAGRIVAEIDGESHDLDRHVDRADRRSRHRAGAGGAAPFSEAHGRRESSARRLPARRARKIKRNLAYCYEAFPGLPERRRQLAGSMSGGEQQMLALARALMPAPRILLVDEPSVGLAPVLVRAPSTRSRSCATTTSSPC